MNNKIYKWLIWFFLMNQFVELFIDLGINLNLLKEVPYKSNNIISSIIFVIFSGIAFTVYTKNMDDNFLNK